MRGMATCKVCGRDFALMKEEHYIARDVFGFVTWDAFDCPHCGCQYKAQDRKSSVNAEEQDKCTDGCNEEEYVGACWECKHYLKSKTDNPCKDCNHNGSKFNKFEQMEG